MIVEEKCDCCKGNAARLRSSALDLQVDGVSDAKGLGICAHGGAISCCWARSPWPGCQAPIAQEAASRSSAHWSSVEGLVEVERAGTLRLADGRARAALCQRIRCGSAPRSRAALALVNDAVLRLDQNTTLQLTDIGPSRRSARSCSWSAVRAAVVQPQAPPAGDQHALSERDDRGHRVRDRRGRAAGLAHGVRRRVTAANELGEVRLASGEAAVAEAGQAPEKRIVVRPRDAVQWALYYPPILAAVGGQAGRQRRTCRRRWPRRMRRADAGDLDGAFAALDAGARTASAMPQYHVYRAGLLLSVGQVAEAEDAHRPRVARRAQGRAWPTRQRSIIELVQNEKEDGARRARARGRAEPEATRAEDRAVLCAAGALPARGGARHAAAGGRASSRRTRWPGRGCPSCG